MVEWPLAMTLQRWMGILIACSACTSSPDIVATRAGSSVGGEPPSTVSGAGSTEGGAGYTGLGGAAGEGGDAPKDPMLLPLMGDLNGNDPAALLDGGTLWIVTGGASIVAKTSTDLVNVEDVGQVLGELPAWVATEVPDAQGMWSPELVHFGGLYHLYYAVSSIGSSRSCIGHATAEELSAASTWADRGPVVCSKSGDDFNAIDPTVLVSSDDEIWLAYGSFLSGIKIGQLDAMGTTFVSDPATIASRADAGGALQAAALTEDDGFFYLFVSFGVGTSHQLMMGRARSIQGPYVDQEGVPMLEGGGSPLLESGARYHGPGSNDVFAMGEQRYHVYHAYDRDNADRATLRVSTLERGDGGWPRSDGP